MARDINKRVGVKEYNDAGALARFYGFQPILAPEIHKQDLEQVKKFDQSVSPGEKAALLRMYFEDKSISQPQPGMYWVERPFKGSGEKKKAHKLECLLVSMGSVKSVCECLAIQAGLAILHSLGYKDAELRLNSVGDKDSCNEFERKMTAFIRKNYNNYPGELRQALKKNVFALLTEPKKEWEQFRTECPKSIDFLSETSRNQFKEILEFLEMMDIPYTIDNTLVGDPSFGSETVFSFVSEKENGERLAFGVRTNRLGKKLGHKKEVPLVTLNIEAKYKKQPKKIKVKPYNPDFYLIQFGPEAKLKSFLVLEELRKAGASVAHSIARDKLGSQMGIAESSNIPYILLMGQKEALDNSIMLRNTATRAQELIPIPELAARIKKLK